MTLLYFVLLLAPIANSYLYPPKAGSTVNYEMMSGLLTGSSILFGFAVLPIEKKKTPSVLWLMVVVDVFFLTLTGFSLFRVGIGDIEQAGSAFVLTAMSFNANAVTALCRHVLAGE